MTEAQWYWTDDDGQEWGPFGAEEVAEMLATRGAHSGVARGQFRREEVR